MYVKGHRSLEVTESLDGLNWGELKQISIGELIGKFNGYVVKAYAGCYDLSVFRIPSKKFAYMLYIKNDEIHYARLKW